MSKSVEEQIAEHPLSPASPLDYMRLLGWLLLAPAKLKAYREQRGAAAVREMGVWLTCALVWLPLLIPSLAGCRRDFPKALNTPTYGGQAHACPCMWR